MTPASATGSSDEDWSIISSSDIEDDARKTIKPEIEDPPVKSEKALASTPTEECGDFMIPVKAKAGKESMASSLSTISKPLLTRLDDLQEKEAEKEADSGSSSQDPTTCRTSPVKPEGHGRARDIFERLSLRAYNVLFARRYTELRAKSTGLSRFDHGLLRVLQVLEAEKYNYCYYAIGIAGLLATRVIYASVLVPALHSTGEFNAQKSLAGSFSWNSVRSYFHDVFYEKAPARPFYARMWAYAPPEQARVAKYWDRAVAYGKALAQWVSESRALKLLAHETHKYAAAPEQVVYDLEALSQRLWHAVQGKVTVLADRVRQNPQLKGAANTCATYAARLLLGLHAWLGEAAASLGNAATWSTSRVQLFLERYPTATSQVNESARSLYLWTQGVYSLFSAGCKTQLENTDCALINSIRTAGRRTAQQASQFYTTYKLWHYTTGASALRQVYSWTLDKWHRVLYPEQT